IFVLAGRDQPILDRTAFEFLELPVENIFIKRTDCFRILGVNLEMVNARHFLILSLCRRFCVAACLPGCSAPADLFEDLGGSFVVAVLVVPIPPLVRRVLRIARGRVLPFLLAPERGDVEVAPGAAHLLVAAAVDEVSAEYAVAVAYERVRAMPLVHGEVLIEIVRDRVPRDEIPAHPRLDTLNVRLRPARDEGERGITRVQMRGVRNLVGYHGAPNTAVIRPAGYARIEKRAINDQLTSAIEKIEQADPAPGPVELVIFFDRDPRHSPTLCGQRVEGTGQFLLLRE